eukprot:GGOE01005223.1.p1 GENE.GGOE01005223.1~~GGOE01005223.1.p1  ORF type:complete len:120 (+),score=4.79 GGOE01005223.1:192-551(+)
MHTTCYEKSWVFTCSASELQEKARAARLSSSLLQTKERSSCLTLPILHLHVHFDNQGLWPTSCLTRKFKVMGWLGRSTLSAIRIPLVLSPVSPSPVLLYVIQADQHNPPPVWCVIVPQQ